jgi:gamma-glutamylputrescine oxidase
VSSTPYWLDEDARPATEPLAEQLFPRPHYARRGFDYWQQLPDGRLVAGGRRDTTLEAEDTAVEETTEVIQAQIEELVRASLAPPAPHPSVGGRLRDDGGPPTARRSGPRS